MERISNITDKKVCRFMYWWDKPKIFALERIDRPGFFFKEFGVRVGGDVFMSYPPLAHFFYVHTPGQMLRLMRLAYALKCQLYRVPPPPREILRNLGLEE
jgi:hypothetical protein